MSPGTTDRDEPPGSEAGPDGAPTVGQTPLTDLLLRRIATTGPITVAEFMAEALLHPVHGYYTTRDPLGAAGDFTTAPEITQMFGELVGLALAQAWLDQGHPAPFTLAELGPGRGTLMADLLRATGAVPGFRDATSVTLVEASPLLRAAQADRVAGARWVDRAESLPQGRPLFLVANEFLDALPIRQFVRDGAGWRERMIKAEGDRLAFALAPPARLDTLETRLEDTAEGEMVELCPALPALVGEIARRIAAHGGCALLVDYGGWRSRGDTLQAVRAHASAEPLDAPGAADLTAHVDFEAVARAARAAGAEAWGPEPQGEWLMRLGLGPRTEALARALPAGPRRESHLAAARRLTEPARMGTVFKAMALTAPGAPSPAGFSGRAPATGPGDPTTRPSPGRPRA
ncbi:MAG: SAM-dependent methyltransferase [Paracoccaceae bacterium]|jgi:SAM-dependent MidA family methyltransferase|nr:SAM-dependent methyltransferase [Paracoccaceae bacterium]